MKTLFTAEATFKSGRLETNQTLNGLEKAKLRDREAGRPALTGLNWSAQSGGSPMRRLDQSAFMQSQLG
jgi:hypothetical protein